MVEPALLSKDHQFKESTAVPSERYPATLEAVPELTVPETPAQFPLVEVHTLTPCS